MITFKEFVVEATQTRNLGSLIGAQGGGVDGNWAGSLPKLISILPMGNWRPTSLKRERESTRSGYTSDHYAGNINAYAADFGLNTTFGNNKESATKFAVSVANNAGAGITSWGPYEGKELTHYTTDGFRVQIIWLSNVGGNHYDHVHVGVKRQSGKNTPSQSTQDNNIPTDSNNTSQGQSASNNSGDYETVSDALKGLSSGVNMLKSSMSKL